MMLPYLRSTALLLALTSLASPAVAAVDTDLDLPTFELEPESGLEVVQNRKFRLDHEFSLWVGTLPLDPFYKALTYTFGYTAHLSDLFGISLEGSYHSNFDTKLRDETFRIALVSGNQPPNFRELRSMLAAHVLMKPLYGKQAVFNTVVVHFEGYIQAGPVGALSCTSALTRFHEVRECNKPSVEVGLDIGAGFRGWISEAWSLRIDINEIIYFPTRAGGKVAVKQALHLRFGIAVNLRGAE